MSRPNHKVAYISEQEYLEDEKVRDIKHEYFDGEIFAMSGAKANHQRITMNVGGEFRQHLKDTPCEAFSSDMKVRADKGNKYFYPDVVVCCNQDGESDFTESPRLIVEVLSKSTRNFDKGLKRLVYQNIPSLEEYVLIEQDFVEIEVCRKADGWKSTYYFLNDDITFTSIDLTLPVIEIYQRVDNEDMRDFLKALETNQQSKTS
jgi:Uma2 family endonuclease